MGKEAKVDESGSLVVRDLPCHMLDIQVQKPIGQGPLAAIPGKIATAVVVAPTGHPKVMVSIIHPDESSLQAIFSNVAEIDAFSEMLKDAHAEAMQIALARKKETKQ